jgi:hypothetical protein
MGFSKREFEKLQQEYPLGEECRAELHWMEQEQYERYPKRKEDTNELYDYD